LPADWDAWTVATLLSLIATKPSAASRWRAAVAVVREPPNSDTISRLLGIFAPSAYSPDSMRPRSFAAISSREAISPLSALRV
jgi:hypothetical protein